MIIFFYFSEKNTSPKLTQSKPTEDCAFIMKDEIRTAIRKMKSSKADSTSVKNIDALEYYKIDKIAT